MEKERIFQKHSKLMALILAFVIIFASGLGSTLAYIITGTNSLINTFISGLNPSGDLTIRKILNHSFGDGYVLPEGQSFTFGVDLGAAYAGKIVTTSQGDMTIDENGWLMVKVAPGGAVTIFDIEENSQVTITEILSNGFSVANGSNPRTVTISRDGVQEVFVNNYAPAPVPYLNISVTGTKTLEGREWQEGDSFTFILEQSEERDDGITWNQVGTATVTHELVEIEDPEDPEKTIWVPKPDFNVFDMTEMLQSVSYKKAGTYSFRLSEETGNVAGITYDSVVSYFDVVVGDRDMDGYLEVQNVQGYQNASVAYDPNTGHFRIEFSVKNIYAPSGEAPVSIWIHKKMISKSGQPYSAAGFTFELYDENGALIGVSEPTSTAGEAVFSTTFGAADVGKTYHFTLKETHAGETIDGVIYDSTEYPLAVSVLDNLDGTVRAVVYLVQEEDNQPPVNVYQPIEEENQSSEAEDAPILDEILSVDEESQPSREDQAHEEEVHFPGMDFGYDFFWEQFVKQKESQIPEDAENFLELTFSNEYDPRDTAVKITGTKKLTGRELQAEEFSFELYAVDADFSLEEHAVPLERVTNKADGSFNFSAISYDTVGEYYYIAMESSDYPLVGVSYDDTRYYVHVKVTDVDGELKATMAVTEHQGQETNIVFHNIYRVDPVFVTFEGKKRLYGGKLRPYQFTFRLYEVNSDLEPMGDPIQSAYNTADGIFTFNGIRHEAPGDYYYLIMEDDTEQVPGMTYDDTVYGIKVSVWDDNTGALQATVTMIEVGGGEVDAIIFENRYVKPVHPTEPSKPTVPSWPTDPSCPVDPSRPTEPSVPSEPGIPSNPSESTEPSVPSDPGGTTEPIETTKPSKPGGPSIPATGDDSPLGLYIALAVISLTSIILLLLVGRKKPKGRYLRK